MKRVTKPDDINHPQIREFASRAVWVAKLEETVEFLEDLRLLRQEDCEEEPAETIDVADEEPLSVALSLIGEYWEDASRALEADLIEWLAQDPEHWGIFNLIVIQSWQTRPGRWRRGLPKWVLALCTETILAHYQHDPYGRQRVIDLGPLTQ